VQKGKRRGLMHPSRGHREAARQKHTSRARLGATRLGFCRDEKFAVFLLCLPDHAKCDSLAMEHPLQESFKGKSGKPAASITRSVRVNSCPAWLNFLFFTCFPVIFHIPFGRVAMLATLNDFWDSDTPSLPTNFVNGRSAYTQFQHHCPY
jgi:hypothetical protein